MTSSKKIADNFSKGAARYDELASCQKHAAEKLASIISMQKKSHGGKLKILELGCGTGFLTEKIFEMFPGSEFTITDISEKMLSLCIGKTSGIPVSKKDFVVCDFDRSIPPGSFDMVISGMAFQWSSDLAKLASSIFDSLNPGGRIFLSMLTEPTFGSLRDTFRELDTQYPGPVFKTEAAIRSYFSAFHDPYFQTETFTEKYRDTTGFLKHLKSIGAGNPTGTGLQAGKLRKIIARHNLKHMDNGFIEAEYQILYGALGK